jgi:hypothetical protein
MRIPPPINFQPQNPLQSGNPRSTDSLNGNGALGGGGASKGSLAASQALARAGVLDAAAQPGLGIASSVFDADTTANNILDMVTLRLQDAVARGASEEELGKLLQQAREGAQAGFDAATTQLKDIGELDDSLTRGIGAALQKVDEGFSRLASELGLDPATANPVKATQVPSLGELASGYNRQFASGQSAELTIKTADGDTVRLRIGVNSAASSDGTRRSSGGVTLEVEGELDADETKALNELVGRVGKLADSFFGGDMNSALQQAQDFEFDNPELSSLSLTLRRSVTTYQDVQSLGSDALADYAANGAGIGGGASLKEQAAAAVASASSIKTQLAEQLSALLPAASFAENPAGTLKELLAAQVGARDQQDNPLLGFANRLLDAMGANRVAADEGAKVAA